MMNRNLFLRRSAVAGSLILFSKWEALADVMKQAGFEITMLTDQIGIFTEKGGTILFHLNQKGIVVVDSQFPDTAVHLIEELKKKSSNPFKYLINTHHHSDHTAGNIAFKDLVKNVVAHENAAINQKAVAVKQKTEDKQLYPDTTFSKTWNKKFGREKMALYYFGPGHTNGDIVVHFKKDNIVHVGDLMFNRRYPYIDKSAGANIKNWIKVLQQIQEKFNDKTRFVFGHANEKYNVTGTKADLKAFEHFLSQLLQFVAGEIQSGKTKEEIIKAKLIPGNTEWVGDGIERGLTAAYTELTENK
jgi:glyoxylase-like metal-dependent hydrolase (beta-lactamase superfamily II)